MIRPLALSVAVCSLFSVGCSAMSPMAAEKRLYQDEAAAEATVAAAPPHTDWAMGGGEMAPGDDDADLLVADGSTAPRLREPKAPKKAGGRVVPKPASGTAVQPGRSHPLLIYTAELHLAVFETAATQQAVADLATKLGGFLAYRDDTRITIRIPARGFTDTVASIEALGDVLHRNVKALDVTEEFRDIAARLRNAEAVRASLAKLLERANKVEDALKVQAELAKVTETIERYKGRLTFLEDRIAYSTVTVVFQPRPRASLNKPSTFRLPFAWLDRVGLPGLLELN